MKKLTEYTDKELIQTYNTWEHDLRNYPFIKELVKRFNKYSRELNPKDNTVWFGD